jgi:glutaredoxin 3
MSQPDSACADTLLFAMDTNALTIYTTPTCGFCHMAKEYFKSKGVAFKERDITRDAEGQQWVLEKTGQLGVPVIDIAGDVIIGFDRPRIDLALRDHKLV